MTDTQLSDANLADIPSDVTTRKRDANNASDMSESAPKKIKLCQCQKKLAAVADICNKAIFDKLKKIKKLKL